jgi:hypothetical protein
MTYAMRPGDVSDVGEAGQELPETRFGTTNGPPLHHLRPVSLAAYQSIQKLVAIYRLSIDTASLAGRDFKRIVRRVHGHPSREREGTERKGRGKDEGNPKASPILDGDFELAPQVTRSR